MTDYIMHQLRHARGSEQRLSATVLARVTEAEQAAIRQLAKRNDRTPSREARRAIRFYLTNFEDADRALREQAEEGQS